MAFTGCSSAKKQSDPTLYGPEPAQPLGPPAPEEIKQVDKIEEYGPTAQKESSEGVVLVLGAIPKAPASLIGAIREIELSGVGIKKIIAIETAAAMAGVYVASESNNKSDWNLTQIYKELQQSEKSFVGQILSKDKKELEKKFEKIFLSKNKGRVQAEFVAATRSQGSWSLLTQGDYLERVITAIKGCGWIDDLGDECASSVKKELYLDLIKDETQHPVFIIQSEVPAEQIENKYFIQIQQPTEEIDAGSRSRHLILGKKAIKLEITKIKTWMTGLKEKR